MFASYIYLRIQINIWCYVSFAPYISLGIQKVIRQLESDDGQNLDN